MGHTVIYSPSDSHQCGLPTTIGKAAGTILRCDGCNRFFKLVPGDWGVYWVPVWFQWWWRRSHGVAS